MILRTYCCPDCDHRIEVVLESSEWDAEPPDCPVCTVRLGQEFKSFGVGGSPQARATKIAQDIMEKDYGATNFEIGKNRPQASAPTRAEQQQRSAILRSMIPDGPAQIAAGSATGGFAPIHKLQQDIRGGKMPDLIRNAAKNSIRVG